MNKKIIALLLISCIVGSCVSSVSANSFTLTSYVSKSVHVWVISNGQNTFDGYFNSYKDSKWVNVHDDGTYYIYLNEYWKPGHNLKFDPLDVLVILYLSLL
ncbi:MAG: hypothetical protein CfClM3_0625 [Methanobrevibacter sp. CfCl-M3]